MIRRNEPESNGSVSVLYAKEWFLRKNVKATRVEPSGKAGSRGQSNLG